MYQQNAKIQNKGSLFEILFLFRGNSIGPFTVFLTKLSMRKKGNGLQLLKEQTSCNLKSTEAKSEKEDKSGQRRTNYKLKKLTCLLYRNRC